jgi:hypothetical protein
VGGLNPAGRHLRGVRHDDEVGLHDIVRVRMTSIGALNTSPTLRSSK